MSAPGGWRTNRPETAGPAVSELAPDSSRRSRVLQLARQLEVCTVIDDSGWLCADVEIRYRRHQGGTIYPVMVRVGSDARDEELVANGGVVGRCGRYNDALNKLRQLGVRLAAATEEHRIALVAGSTIAYAHRELSRLDALIIHRQVMYMGHRTVRLHRLVRESEFFEDRYAALAPIVLAAEQGVITAWDGDTQEMGFDD